MNTNSIKQQSAAAKAGEQKKPRLAAVEYIRGIAMLGVVGIHVGSLYMENPAANIYLAATFEALTRFAVPIFFFISAFGLFYNLREPFSYGSFLRRRLGAVFVPYLFWSVFYVQHDARYFNVPVPTLSDFAHDLFFGTTKYHLYFLVILLWFYILMPLFIPIVKRIGTKTLTLLFAAQVAFDYFSSYSTSFGTFVWSMPDSFLKDCFVYRLNFWVLHYFFIFVLGGVMACHFDRLRPLLREKFALLTAFFCVGAAGMFAHFLWLVKITGYSPVSATNTAHQLSPVGIIYTAAASLFFFAFFSIQPYRAKLMNPIFSLCGRHSYFVYLAHPLLLEYIVAPGQLLTAANAIGVYCFTVATTLFFAIILRTVGKKIPLLNRLTIGSAQ